MIVVVFRSRLVSDTPMEEFNDLSVDLYRACSGLPGFISEKSFTADDGERLTIVEFASEESLRAWRDYPKHRSAQERGRARYYEEYTNQVCVEIRRSEFKKAPGSRMAPDTGVGPRSG